MTLDEALAQVARRLFAHESDLATVSWEDVAGLTRSADGHIEQNGTATFILHINGGATDIERDGAIERHSPKVIVLG